MKSERLKFTILISILIFTIIFPITINLMNNTSREERQKSIINIPKLSAETEWVPNGTVIYDDDPWTQGWPQICSDGEGGAIIAWYDYRFAIYHIYAQRIDSNGNLLWDPNGTAIRPESMNIVYDSIKICSDGYGGAIIVWVEYVDAVEEYNIYAQKINANGITQWTPNGTAVCSEIGFQSRPQVCNDGMGGAIVSWQDDRNGVDWDIYAQRINETGGIEWTPNGTAICTTANNERFPQMISDGQGGAIITWHAGLDIWAQKINFGGINQWDANGTVICSDGDLQELPQLCNDGDGGAIIIWEDERGGDYNIYAQSINSTGVVQWTPDGVAVCTYYNEIETPQICSDGVNGAIVTWAIFGIYVGWDIYAQRLNMLGIPQWNSIVGIPICEAEDHQINPQICSDGNGGAIITWEDERNDYGDIYAQKIDANGQNSTYNRAICTVEDEQADPKLCSDGLGGAIITWMDNRGTNTGVYALRMDDLPYSNHPADFDTYLDGSEVISWTLFDDTTGGKYRVIANDTNGNFYVWVNWISWNHNVPLSIPLNRTERGFFSYRIEYYDELNQNGIPDTVIVLIKAHPSEEVIPLGHYYLLFIILSVAAIIIVKKFHIKQK